MVRGLEDFLDDDNDYVCPHCGEEARPRAESGGSVLIKCDDSSCEGFFPGTVARDLHDVADDGVISFTVDEEWVDGEPTEVEYQCLDCGSREQIERIGHDDGYGMVDVKIECDACGASGWE